MVERATDPEPRASPRSLRGDVLLTLPTQVVLLVIAIAMSIVLARSLGPTGRGAVAVAFSLALVLVQVGTFGVATANPYYIGQAPQTRDRLVANSVLIAIVAGVGMAAVGVLVRLVAPGALQGVGATDLTIALGAIPVILLAKFLQSVLLGEGRMVAYNAAELATSVLTLAVLAALAAADGLDVRAALIVLVAGRVAAAAAFVRLTTTSWRTRPDLQLARTMLGYGFRVYAATLLAFLVIRIDMLLVNAYVGPGQAGLYAVAVALADALYILPSVVAVNLFAHVARGADDATTAAVFRSLAIVYLSVCAAAALLAGPAITLVYGGAFSDAAALFQWLAPGIFCLGMLNVLAQHFAGRGFPLAAALVWVAGLALNIAINLIFLPGGPTYVASIASSAAYLLLLVLHVRMFARRTGDASLMPRPAETAALIRRLFTRGGKEALG